MKKIWNKMLKPALKIFGVHRVVRWFKDSAEKSSLSQKNAQEIFTNIYHSNAWNGAESVSGQGSDLIETSELIKQMPAFLTRHNIKTMIDLPCGDYNWMQYLDYDFGHYTGIDIVEDIIEANNIKFGDDTHDFIVKDCLSDDIGKADMLMCRDLLIHFRNADVKQFFDNIKRAEIKYLLTTHFIDEKNVDILTGQWRPVNLTAAPFNLPAPIDIIVEKTKMFNGKYADTKVMALWRVADI